MRERLLPVLFVGGFAACTYDPSGAPTPIACQPSVYRIESVAMPRTGAAAAQLALDLDGDGTADNRLGRLHATLASFFSDWRPDEHLTARLAGERAAPWLLSVERCEGTLAVGLVRGRDDGAALEPIGTPAIGADTGAGLLRAFDGRGAVPLHGFTDGLGASDDDGWVDAAGLAVALALDPDDGSIDATIGAGLDLTDVALTPVAAFLTTHLADSLIARALDADHDRTITVAELRASETVAALIALDVDVAEADGVLDHASIAFSIHARPL